MSDKQQSVESDKSFSVLLNEERHKIPLGAVEPLLDILFKIVLSSGSPNLHNTLMYQCAVCTKPTSVRLVEMGECNGHTLHGSELTLENFTECAERIIERLETRSS